MIASHAVSQRSIDLYLPRYTFGHRYRIVVNSGDIDTVYKITRDVDLSKSKIILLLFKLRGLPLGKLNARDFTAAMGWTTLEDSAPREFVIGYWRSNKIEPITDRKQFISKTTDVTQKVVFSFRFRHIGWNQVEIDTETRVLCIGFTSKLAFWFYWIAIKPFSGWIRKEILKIVKREAEARTRDGEAA